LGAVPRFDPPTGLSAAAVEAWDVSWQDYRPALLLTPSSRTLLLRWDHTEVVVAVDMALRRDSVAGVIARKRADGKIAVQPRIWAAPADGKIDHLEVLDHIRGLARRYTVAEIVYDPRFFEVPARVVEDEGHNLVELPQSANVWHPRAGTRCR
jgi:hypothetical protein